MWVQVEQQRLCTWVTITRAPFLTTNPSSVGDVIRTENSVSARQRAVSTRHKASIRSEQIVMPSLLRSVKDSHVHSLMTVRSSAGVMTTLVNVVMVVDTVVISDLHQAQPFLSRPAELQHKSLRENSMSVPSSTMLLSFVGARTQRDNWAMVQPRIALRQLPPHRSVLAIPCPTFQLVTTTSALC